MKYIFKEKDIASLITIPHIQMSVTEIIIPEEKFTVNDIRFYDASLSTCRYVNCIDSTTNINCGLNRRKHATDYSQRSSVLKPRIHQGDLLVLVFPTRVTAQSGRRVT